MGFCWRYESRKRRAKGSDWTTCLAARFMGSRHCAAAFFLRVPKSCTDLDPTLLYILILQTHNKIRTEKLNASARCLLAAAATLLEQRLPNNWFVSTRRKSMKCFVNWIQRICTFVRTNPNPVLIGSQIHVRFAVWVPNPRAIRSMGWLRSVGSIKL